MRVFVSYSPDDESLKNDLLKQLGPAIRAGRLSPWDASKVQPGDEPQVVSEAELGRADVALVLLSADYLAAGGPADRDLGRIAAGRIQSGLRVVPILLSACDWQTDVRIKDLQALPRDGRPISSHRDRDEALVQVCREIITLGLSSEPGAHSAKQTPAADVTTNAAMLRPARSESQTMARTLSWRNPGSVLSAAVAAVPVMKYALGVAGLAAVVAIITRGFGLDAATATGGALVVLALMAVLIILAAAARQDRGMVKPALVLTWAVLCLTLCSSALLLTSLFFFWPRPLHCLTHNELCDVKQGRGGAGAAGGLDAGAAASAVPKIPTDDSPATAAPISQITLRAKPVPGGAEIQTHSAGRTTIPAESAARTSAAPAVVGEINSDNVIEDSPDAKMRNRAKLPARKGPLRANSGNEIKDSKGAQMDNQIDVTP